LRLVLNGAYEPVDILPPPKLDYPTQSLQTDRGVLLSATQVSSRRLGFFFRVPYCCPEVLLQHQGYGSS